MSKILFEETRLNKITRAKIDVANAILFEYASQGYQMTLRQLYYQFVARDILPNNDKEYKKLGNAIKVGRRNGLIDWDLIVDRTRFLRRLPTFNNPEEAYSQMLKNYKIDMWENQPARVEVWIEKDALVGVIAGVCQRLRVPYFSCRGYASESALYEAGYNRFGQYLEWGQEVVVLHLADHDPSGIDMTRDIEERLNMFSWDFGEIQVWRIGLTKAQIREHQPPPNPAKLSDKRAKAYIEEHGYESYELDALPPDVMAKTIEDAVKFYTDFDRWEEAQAREQKEIRRLLRVRWEDDYE